jgi:hypothetical protein
VSKAPLATLAPPATPARQAPLAAVARDDVTSTVTITCEDGTTAVVNDGQLGPTGGPGPTGPAGPAGADGAGCEVAANDDGSFTVTCGASDPITLANGVDGLPGADGQDGQDGEDGTNGEDGQDGAQSLVRVEPVDPGGDCPNGGVSIHRGLDDNGDGILQDTEQDGPTAYVCNGAGGNFIPGDFTVNDANDVTALQGVVAVGGNLHILDSNLTTLSLPTLFDVGGNVYISGNDQLTNLSLGALKNVGGWLSADENGALTNLNLGALSTTGQHIYIGDHAGLTSLNLSAFTRSGGDYIVSTNSDAAISTSLGPDYVGQGYYFGDNSGVSTLSLGGLFVGEDFTLYNNSDLGTLTAVGTIFGQGDLTIQRNDLSEATILAFLDSYFAPEGIFANITPDE